MPIANLRDVTRHANTSFSRAIPHCGHTDHYQSPAVESAGRGCQGRPGPTVGQSRHEPPAGSSVEEYDADGDEELAEEIKEYALDKKCDWATAKAAVRRAHDAGRETKYARTAEAEVQLRRLSRQMDAIEADYRGKQNEVRGMQVDSIVEFATKNGVGYDEAKAMLARGRDRYRRQTPGKLSPEFLVAVHTEKLARGECLSYRELQTEFS